MFMILMISLSIFLISFIVMLLASILSKKNFNSPSKKISIWMWVWSKIFVTFTFLNSILFNYNYFLIFDEEIALILPMIIIFKYSHMLIWSILSIIFILILLIGLYHEWNQGMLNWSN